LNIADSGRSDIPAYIREALEAETLIQEKHDTFTVEDLDAVGSDIDDFNWEDIATKGKIIDGNPQQDTLEVKSLDRDAAPPPLMTLPSSSSGSSTPSHGEFVHFL
jgi:hypothetical protein